MTSNSLSSPTIPFLHPERVKPKFRPFKAMHHFRKLMADKEDTEQVFHITVALVSPRFGQIAHQFWHSEAGQQHIGGDQRLIDILDDHATLRTYPKGSVAHAYCDFMEREGLTAAGLEAEYAKFTTSYQRFEDGMDRYTDRLRDTHDLFHVLTGYGRDALGEQCVLAFTFAQNRNLGVGFIAYAGGLELKRRVDRRAPIIAAIREGHRMGKAAQNLAQQDILALLKEDLGAARARLGITVPTAYHAAHAAMRDHGVDPYNLLAAAA
jgi:ubiquinone biosynthesis protein COQ4